MNDAGDRDIGPDFDDLEHGVQEIFEDLDRAVQEVFDELRQATAKFGPFASAHEGYAVILEELDELWDAVKANDIEQARREAVQVAAMAMRFIIDIPAPDGG